VPHATLGKLLLKRVSGILEPLAGCLDVVDRDGDVAVAPVRLGVSVGDAVVGVVLGAVVVGEFENGVAVCPVTFALEGLGPVVGEKVEGELVVREVELLDLVQAEELVELN
jgi:hypothetical protein